MQMFGLRYLPDSIYNCEFDWFETKEELMRELSRWIDKGCNLSDFQIVVEYTLDEVKAYF